MTEHATKFSGPVRDIPTYKEIPDCEHEQTGKIRWAIYSGADRSQPDKIEALYRAGNGELFWAPIPHVLNPEQVKT